MAILVAKKEASKLMKRFKNEIKKKNKFVLQFLGSNDDRKKRPRTAFSASQIKALETEFERGKYLSVAKRTALAKQLHLTETQVQTIKQTKINPS